MKERKGKKEKRKKKKENEKEKEKEKEETTCPSTGHDILRDMILCMVHRAYDFMNNALVPSFNRCFLHMQLEQPFKLWLDPCQFRNIFGNCQIHHIGKLSQELEQTGRGRHCNWKIAFRRRNDWRFTAGTEAGHCQQAQQEREQLKR